MRHEIDSWPRYVCGHLHMKTLVNPCIPSAGSYRFCNLTCNIDFAAHRAHIELPADAGFLAALLRKG